MTHDVSGEIQNWLRNVRGLPYSVRSTVSSLHLAWPWRGLGLGASLVHATANFGLCIAHFAAMAHAHGPSAVGGARLCAECIYLQINDYSSLQMQMFGAVPPEVRISSAGRVFRRLQRKSSQAADVPGAPRKSSGG